MNIIITVKAVTLSRGCPHEKPYPGMRADVSHWHRLLLALHETRRWKDRWVELLAGKQQAMEWQGEAVLGLVRHARAGQRRGGLQAW